jgi:hypothetical protein
MGTTCSEDTTVGPMEVISKLFQVYLPITRYGCPLQCGGSMIGVPRIRAFSI